MGNSRESPLKDQVSSRGHRSGTTRAATYALPVGDRHLANPMLVLQRLCGTKDAPWGRIIILFVFPMEPVASSVICGWSEFTKPISP